MKVADKKTDPQVSVEKSDKKGGVQKPKRHYGVTRVTRMMVAPGINISKHYTTLANELVALIIKDTVKGATRKSGDRPTIKPCDLGSSSHRVIVVGKTTPARPLTFKLLKPYLKGEGVTFNHSTGEFECIEDSE